MQGNPTVRLRAYPLPSMRPEGLPHAFGLRRGGDQVVSKHTSSKPERLLDVREAAEMLGLKSPRTLYKWAYAGRVPSVKIGRLLRFRLSELERLIAAGERGAFAPLNDEPLTARTVPR